MRPMSPEQLFYSLMRVTDYEETMKKVAKKQEERMKKRMKEQGDEAMMGNVEVVEVYSPPRVVEEARKAGMATQENSSLDLTTTDYDGKPWNFQNSR